MSADSPKSSSTSACLPRVVPPEPSNDRTLIDSVTGFINDVTLTNAPVTDPDNTILWARFEHLADVSDPTFGNDWDFEGGVAPPLILILGYGTGIQVWAIPANGEAIEVLAWHYGFVRSLRLLPTPHDGGTSPVEEEVVDNFAVHRPLMALCDSTTTAGGPQFCSVNFVSLKDGGHVKVIKFKNPVFDILANRSCVAVIFAEKIAVFDARTLEDRLTVTTCYPSPGLSPNPVALGNRWLAYAERKLMPSKRSYGGCDGDGVQSYTATMLNAAKSLGKGLRELGEQVAAGLTGNMTHSPSTSFTQTGAPSSMASIDGLQPGVITIIDTRYPIKETSPTTGAPISAGGVDPIVAHFIAHSDAIVALQFDNSGLLLLSADRRGHDFHIFRIYPHPSGSSLAAVHHLYILHRGDTSAKVQDMTFSMDSRWIAVSTARGTCHVFPITPYGGPIGYRTHVSSHVVNKLSRFHRSAGLSNDGRSNSPISGGGEGVNQLTMAYNNPRIPPFAHPTIVNALAQLRVPGMINSVAGVTNYNITTGGRPRISSLNDDLTMKPLRVCATFAKPRAWLLDPPQSTRESTGLRLQPKATDSLFLMGANGILVQYDLEPRPASGVPKEKLCNESPIELDSESKAQWNLLRGTESCDIQPPLPVDSWLMKDRLLDDVNASGEDDAQGFYDKDDRWLSQVEIVTHAGPHRRLWMGPQFMFKTYNTPSGHSLSYIDSESVEVVTAGSMINRPARSNPMNMPMSGTNSDVVPVVIESGSYSSYEQSPRMVDLMGPDSSIDPSDSQLREDLADAMRESPAQFRDSGLSSSATSLSSSVTSTVSRNTNVTIAKIVNPLGMVTNISNDLNVAKNDDIIDDSDNYVLENCDEALFRPVVTVVTATNNPTDTEDNQMLRDRPTPVGTELIVPVIDEATYLANKQKKLKADEKKSTSLNDDGGKKTKNTKGQKQRKNSRQEKPDSSFEKIDMAKVAIVPGDDNTSATIESKVSPPVVEIPEEVPKSKKSATVKKRDQKGKKSKEDLSNKTEQVEADNSTKDFEMIPADIVSQMHDIELPSTSTKVMDKLKKEAFDLKDDHTYEEFVDVDLPPQSYIEAVQESLMKDQQVGMKKSKKSRKSSNASDGKPIEMPLPSPNVIEQSVQINLAPSTVNAPSFTDGVEHETIQIEPTTIMDIMYKSFQTEPVDLGNMSDDELVNYLGWDEPLEQDKTPDPEELQPLIEMTVSMNTSESDNTNIKTLPKEPASINMGINQQQSNGSDSGEPTNQSDGNKQLRQTSGTVQHQTKKKNSRKKRR